MFPSLGTCTRRTRELSLNSQMVMKDGLPESYALQSAPHTMTTPSMDRKVIVDTNQMWIGKPTGKSTKGIRLRVVSYSAAPTGSMTSGELRQLTLGCA